MSQFMPISSSYTQSHSWSVHGLRCNNCAIGLEKKLNNHNNVNATVSYATEKISLTCPPQQLQTVIDSVFDAGYQLVINTERFDVIGWTCSGCANKTVKQLESMTGIKNVVANAATNSLSFDRHNDIVSINQIKNRVKKLGYQLSATSQTADTEPSNNRFMGRVNWALFIAISATIVLMAPMFAMLFNSSFKLNPWLEFSLATVIQFVIGARFYRGAWTSLKNKQANMDTLVALGTSAAYFYSCYVLLFINSVDRHFYFESSAVVITFVTIGKWLESRAKYSAGEAMRELLALTPLNANLLVDDTMVETSIENISVGQTVRVFAGAKIPVDGVISKGASEIDESLITGENFLVVKKVTDNVYAGAINGQGVIEVNVTAVGDNSSLSQIITMVEKAQSRKAPIEKLVDSIAAYFVPVVLVIALITFVGWLSVGYSFEIALINSVAVLVVACPCALGLATPAAIVVGSGVAAKQGIIIRDPQALQIAGKIDTVAFDKTGTLTMGTPVLVDTHWAGQATNTEYLSLLKSMVEHSDHPLSSAIAAADFLTAILVTPLTDYQAHPGLGMSAKYQGVDVLIGNSEFLTSHHINMAVAEHSAPINSQASVVFFAVDNQLIAQFSLQDDIRPQSRLAISNLTKDGINTLMLSGDSLPAVSFVANKLAITNFKAGLKPKNKLQHIEQLQQEGACIAMVGDGINDAPALAQANLGFAMGGGTQTAISSAHITLMQDNPQLVKIAIDIAKATWRTVKQNLALAFVFNACAIPAAAMGYLTPQLAGLAMALSSVTVLANALLLKRLM
jgi:Cu+-exporting ATPase